MEHVWKTLLNKLEICGQHSWGFGNPIIMDVISSKKSVCCYQNTLEHPGNFLEVAILKSLEMRNMEDKRNSRFS